MVAQLMNGAFEKPLWIEIPRPDGRVLARHGSTRARLFSSEEQGAHFRNRKPLFKVVAASPGEAVVEVFPFYSPGLTALPPPATSDTSPSTPCRSLIIVEIAAPLVVRDAVGI
jgi:hypothetical protein